MHIFEVKGGKIARFGDSLGGILVSNGTHLCGSDVDFGTGNDEKCAVETL